VIADQRANARWLTSNRIKGIDAGDLHIELHARVLVEQVEGFLGGCVPVSIHGAGFASDSAQFGLERAWKIDRRRLIGLIGRWR
jgi:hypothetical protein